MLDRLPGVAKDARLAAELSLAEIAAAAGVSTATVSRFENSKRRQLRRLDELIAAYEQECGLGKGDLWRRAASSTGS